MIKNSKGKVEILLIILIIILIVIIVIKITLQQTSVEKTGKEIHIYQENIKETNTNQEEAIINKENKANIKEIKNIEGIKNLKKLEEEYSYYNPVIPVGFKTIETETASWNINYDEKLQKNIVQGYNEGLVIQDKQGNEFVWVPVNNENVEYEIYYNFEEQSDNYIAESMPEGANKTEEEMVENYGGFYIARYEAGLPKTLKEAQTMASLEQRNVLENPVSKKNYTPWNCIDWKHAKENSENMYKFEQTNNKVQSILITEKMWDTTMRWFQTEKINVTSDSTKWGNYIDSKVTEITKYSPRKAMEWQETEKITKGTGEEYKWILPTGHTEYTKQKNIYDLAGNLWEYTNSKHNRIKYYTMRGGVYNYEGTICTAAFRCSTYGTGYVDERI